MKARSSLVPAALALMALVVGACSSGGSTTSNESGTLTVWLMDGSAPDSVVQGVTKDFNAKYPNVTVRVELQKWGDIGTKLDTAFAGSTPPDVVELGNMLVARYAAAGALADETGKRSGYENSSTWLQSLTDSCTVNGKLYCIPYYAGSRAIVYRTDIFHVADIKQVPDSLDSLMTVGQKLMFANRLDTNFSAFYFPGRYWHAALPFIWDFGGDIASQSGGQWKGQLDSSGSQAGLLALNNLVSNLSRADRQGDEARQDQAFAQGRIAMIVANGSEIGVLLDAKSGGDPSLKDKLGVFPIPSHNAGQTAPVFLSGSDLGIAAKSKNQGLANEWVKLLAGGKFQKQMATVGKVIPNTTSLLGLNDSDPLIGTFAKAARNSRFVPNSPNWANVEASNVIPDLLVNVFTGRTTFEVAIKTASDKVAQILNAKT